MKERKKEEDEEEQEEEEQEQEEKDRRGSRVGFVLMLLPTTPGTEAFPSPSAPASTT